MNFRWFSLEEIYHGMITEGNEKEERSPRIPGGGKGSLSISHFCLVQILFNLLTGEKILREKHPLVGYAELYELHYLKKEIAKEVWKSSSKSLGKKEFQVRRPRFKTLSTFTSCLSWTQQ